jgi:hypothetical protein
MIVAPPSPGNLRRRAVPAFAAVVLAAVAGSASASLQTTTLLTPGMELTYESSSGRGTPWKVDLVERNLSLGGRTGCLRVRFAPGGPKATADERTTCEGDGMLFTWDTTAKVWRQARPIAPNGALEIRGATTVVKYTTAGAHEDHIDGLAIRVLETTVLTTDSAGRQVRRLRERYAPGLGTATWGAFETRDTTAASGWRVAQEFRLVAIKRP